MEEGEDPRRNEAMMEAFIQMKLMVEELYNQDQKKVSKEVESLARAEGEGVGGDTLDPASPPSSSSSESEHSSHNKRSFNKSLYSKYFPLLNLDVKFDLPVYDGELNAEKLDINQTDISILQGPKDRG